MGNGELLTSRNSQAPFTLSDVLFSLPYFSCPLIFENAA